MNMTSIVPIQPAYDYLCSVPLSGKSAAWTALNAGVGTLLEIASPQAVLVQAVVSTVLKPLFDPYGLELEDHVRNTSLSYLEVPVKWIAPVAREIVAIKAAGIIDRNYGVIEYLHIGVFSLVVPVATTIFGVAAAILHLMPENRN